MVVLVLSISFIYQADSISASINSVKEAGAAKMHEMGRVAEAIMKQVQLSLCLLGGW